MKPNSLFKRFILFPLLLSFVPCLFFVAIELSLRFFVYPLIKQNKNIFRYSLCCGNKLKPNPNSPYEIDRFGFRRTPFNFSNMPVEEVYRIVTLGDSITFGSTNDEYLNYPAYLELILNSADFQLNLPDKKKYVDILNAGIMGYTSEQTKNYLIDTILDFTPDAVILSIGANDLRRSKSPITLFLERHIQGFFWFYYTSALNSSLRKLILPSINLSKGIKNGKSLRKRTLLKKKNYALSIYKQNLIETIRLLNANKINSILVPWSFTSGVAADYVDEFLFKDMKIRNSELLSLYGLFANVMKEVAREYDVPLIQTPFQIPINPPKHNVQFFMASSIHFNNAGSRVLAYSLAKTIRKILKGENIKEINMHSWGNQNDGDILDFYVSVKADFEMKSSAKIRQVIKMREKKIADYCMAFTQKDYSIKNLHFSECFFAVPDTALNYIDENRPKAARAYLDYAVKVYSQWAYPFYVYGIYQLHFGEKKRAKELFETAVKLAPYFKSPKIILRDRF